MLSLILPWIPALRILALHPLSPLFYILLPRLCLLPFWLLVDMRKRHIVATAFINLIILIRLIIIQAAFCTDPSSVKLPPA